MQAFSDGVSAVTITLQALDLLLLAFVAAIPFVTSILAGYLWESGASATTAGVR